jgi:general secretion pathway protein D
MKTIITAPLIAALTATLALGPHVLAQAPAAPTPPPTPASGPPSPRPTTPTPRRRPTRPAPAAPTRVTPPIPVISGPATATPAPGGAPAAGSSDFPGEKEFNQCKKIPPGRTIKLNLKPETEISDLIGTISSITCTPFLVSSLVSLSGKKVTVIAPEAMTAGEAYRLFYAALDSVNLTVEPSGKFLRIVDTAAAKGSKLPYYGEGQAIPNDKRFITKMVRVENLDAADLVANVLSKIKGPAGDIVAYRSSLIITDTAENIERLLQVIKDFDLPSAFAEQLWQIRIKNMSASEMANRLAEIVPVQQGVSTGRRGGAPAGPAPAPAGAGAARANVQLALPGDLNAEMSINKIVADERSNSLLVVANRRAYDWLITLVRKLDQPIDGGSAEGGGDGKVHVYYCENANCDELAATLSAVAGVSVVGSTGAQRRPRTSTPGQPGFAPPAPAPQQGGGQGGQQAQSLLFEGDVRITFDAPTNSLLVVSSFKDFQALRKVISKLDAPRKQVFIEALILEVLLDKSRDIGVAYHGGKPLDFPGGEQSLLIGGFEASKTLSPTSLISNLGGLTGALFGPTIPAQNLQLFGTAVQLPSFGVFLQLLQQNSDVNVLSNPSLLITNNQEGEISVGENLPFPSQLLGGFGGLPGQQGALGGLGGFPSVGVQRQDVALTMKITPSVNEHNMIRLDIDQVIQDVSNPNFNGLGPATSKRSAKTEVVARDQQTVVIGGLMTDRVSETVKKIPILGDIPVLGFFFRSTSKTMQKKNIIIALTPYVITDLSDLRRVAEKKMRERREFIDRYSSLEDKAQVETDIDYRRKRGMLEEINRTAREAEEEEAELRRIRARDTLDDSAPIEPPGRRIPSAGRFSPARVLPASTAAAAPTQTAVTPPPLPAAPPQGPAQVGEGAAPPVLPAPAPTTPPPPPPPPPANQ